MGLLDEDYFGGDSDFAMAPHTYTLAGRLRVGALKPKWKG